MWLYAKFDFHTGLLMHLAATFQFDFFGYFADAITLTLAIRSGQSSQIPNALRAAKSCSNNFPGLRRQLKFGKLFALFERRLQAFVHAFKK